MKSVYDLTGGNKTRHLNIFKNPAMLLRLWEELVRTKSSCSGSSQTSR